MICENHTEAKLLD